MNKALDTVVETVDAIQDSLVEDLQHVVSETESLLNEVACFTGEEFATARTTISNRLDSARSKLGDAQRILARKARYTNRVTKDYVASHPWSVLGAVALIGIAMGLLIRRR